MLTRSNIKNLSALLIIGIAGSYNVTGSSEKCINTDIEHSANHSPDIPIFKTGLTTSFISSFPDDAILMCFIAREYVVQLITNHFTQANEIAGSVKFSKRKWLLPVFT